ncbi:MAG TPA: sulfite exporter TauE/SafE family protein [Polyangiales bacterium]|nr:sulfite exporter TauE/SafE family protein [Polyangiales bacterium]
MSGAVSRAAGTSGLPRYQAGRLVGYAFLGAVSGHFGRALQLIVPSRVSVWIPAALAAAACLLTAYGLLKPTIRGGGLVQLRATGARRSLFSLLFALVPKEPLVLGAVSALLPCGVLASAVLAAVAAGDAASGALLMAAFAAVSGVAVWSAGFATQILPERFGPKLRHALVYVLVIMAALAVYRPIHALTQAEHSVACH